MKFKTLLVICLTALIAGQAAAITVLIISARDNTLYQATGTTNSNGAGEHFFAGRTDDGYIRRGIIAFNITNFIPPSSTITGVTLTLNMSRTRDRSEDITSHRMLANWGEGTSNAA